VAHALEAAGATEQAAQRAATDVQCTIIASPRLHSLRLPGLVLRPTTRKEAFLTPKKPTLSNKRMPLHSTCLGVRPPWSLLVRTVGPPLHHSGGEMRAVIPFVMLAVCPCRLPG
jgi:hypothetical protein